MIRAVCFDVIYAYYPFIVCNASLCTNTYSGKNHSVTKAYCEGILDSSVKDYFRPKDKLTNAEAVSMLNVTGQKHWASSQIDAEAITLIARISNKYN